MLDNLAKDFLKKGSMEDAIMMLRECQGKGWYNLSLLLGRAFEKMFQIEIISHELALSAFKSGDVQLAFKLYEKVLESRGLNETFANTQVFNQHFCIEAVKDNHIHYNKDKVEQIMNRPKNSFPLITLTMTTCKRFDLFEQTINSFLNCCKDLDRIDKWLCVDDNSSSQDRQKMKLKYPFFEFYFKTPREKGHPQSMNIIRNKVDTPYMFHMEDDWKFFAERNYISDCMNVLVRKPQIGQCLINKNYSEVAKNVSVKGGIFNETPSGLRFYIHEFANTKELKEKFIEKYGNSLNSSYWPHFSFRPSLLRTHILKDLGAFNEKVSHFEMEYAYRYISRGYVSAFLEGIYCLHTGRLTSEINDETKLNAYILNGEKQFSGKEESLVSGNNTTKKSISDLNMKTYVLNLDRRPDRWTEFLKNQVAKCLNYERFSAVDGSKLVPTEQLQRIFDGNDYNMRQGMVGCAMSHIKMYIELLNSEYDFFCILEDDLDFVPDFERKFLHIFNELPSDWDMCYLGHHLWKYYKKPEYYDKETFPILEKWDKQTSLQRSMGGTGGYLISKKGAEKLLQFIERTGMTNGIDTVQQKSADELDIYYCKPHLIYSECWTGENDPDTDIQHNYTSLTIPIEKRLEDQLKFFQNFCKVPDYIQAEEYVKDITKTEMMFYVFKNNEDVQKLKKECVHPFYTLNDKVIIVVPNPTAHQKVFCPFERFKVDGCYDISKTLEYKVDQQHRNIITIGEMSFLSEAVRSLGVNDMDFPFDKLDGTFDTFSRLSRKVLKMSEDELDSFVEGFFDQSKNETFVQTWNGKVVFKNVEYDLAFPHDELITLTDVYKYRFRNLRERVNDKSPLVFVHASRWERIEEKELVEFLDVMKEYNPDIKFITINGFDLVPESLADCVLTGSVDFPEKFRNNNWSNEKIMFDQTKFRSRLNKKICEVFVKL